MPNNIANVSRDGSHCVVCLLKWSIRALATRLSVTDKSGARLIDLKAINISRRCGNIFYPKSYRIASVGCVASISDKTVPENCYDRSARWIAIIFLGWHLHFAHRERFE